MNEAILFIETIPETIFNRKHFRLSRKAKARLLHFLVCLLIGVISASSLIAMICGMVAVDPTGISPKVLAGEFLLLTSLVTSYFYFH